MTEESIKDITMIYEMLSECSMTTRQIEEYSIVKYKSELPSYKVRGYLWDELKKFVSYDKYTYSYTLSTSCTIDTILDSVSSKKEKRKRRKRIVTPKPEIVFKQKARRNDSLQNLYPYSDNCVFKQTQAHLKKEFLNLNINNKALEDIIVRITKDNRITEIEEKFLVQKINEYGLDNNILEVAKKAVNENNPYLDDILHVIFEDRKITLEELMFLKEKVDEKEINRDATVRRFWQIGFIFYPTTFQNIEGFTRFLKLKYLYHLMSDKEYEFEYLDLFRVSEFESIFRNANARITDLILDLIVKMKMDFDASDINAHLDKIEIGRIHDYVGKDPGIISDHWKLIYDNARQKAIEFDILNRKIIMSNRNNRSDREIFIEFITQLFEQRKYHRSPEIDLFFENFEDFYNGEG